MADNYRNWGNQSRQSDQNWENEHSRFNDESKRRYLGDNEDDNNAGYRNSYYDSRNKSGSYGNTWGQYGSVHQGDFNRTNYIPDNDENRNYRDRDYEDTQYGTSGTYGYRGDSANDYNPGGYYRGEEKGSFGHTAGDRTEYGRSKGWGRNDMSSGYYGSRNEQGNYDRDYGQQYRDQENRYGNMGNRSGEYRSEFNRYRNDNDAGISNRTGNYGESYNRSYDSSENRGMRNWNNRTGDQYTGGHRGKGPKDYQRSETRIREDVCDRLSEDDYLDATDIQVQVQGSEVILSGNVVDRDQKRRAENLAESISGVQNVENRIHVSHHGGHDYTGTTDQMGGIGNESGTTNEVIRNARNEQGRGKNSKNER